MHRLGCFASVVVQINGLSGLDSASVAIQMHRLSDLASSSVQMDVVASLASYFLKRRC